MKKIYEQPEFRFRHIELVDDALVISSTSQTDVPIPTATAATSPQIGDDF